MENVEYHSAQFISRINIISVKHILYHVTKQFVETEIMFSRTLLSHAEEHTVLYIYRYK